MKIAHAVIALSLSLTSVSALADRYSEQVGKQTIVRSVITKKLVKAEDRQVLALALETGKASVGKMVCDRGLGQDNCQLEIIVHDDKTTDEAEETLYQLDVYIYQGTVLSATLELIAG